MTKSVVVIGGGVIGAACAYYLNRDGWSVTVVDRGRFGAGCSHGNCGFVCPSHVLPLAAPGAVRSGLKALFQRNGPLRIKPRLDPALWSWLYRFARCCNSRDMLKAGHGIQALLNSSRRLYDEILTAEGIDCEWDAKGMLFVFQTKPAMEHYAHTDRLLSEEFGLSAKRFDGDDVAQLEPALKRGLAGGWHYDTDAHLRPDRLMTEWRRVLENRGVKIQDNCEVTSIARDGSTARAVVTNGGEFAADAFVVATGAWTPLLNRELGCWIPIQPGKGYSITMPRPALCPAIPLIFEEHRVAVTPMRTGYRLGSTMEFAGYDSSLNPERLNLLRDGATHYLQEPAAEPVVEQWFGWRPMTPDGLPVIDRSPAMANVMIAAGHNMLGLSMAPATGRLVAELLGEHATHINATAFSMSRF
jgi:D-amino-acid dehydrogenase